MGSLSSGSSTTINKSPNQQYEHCADNSADKAGILTRPIPANGLPKVGCRQSANDAKDRCQYKTLRPFITGVTAIAMILATKLIIIVQIKCNMFSILAGC
jgi:hypothetical protein